MLEQIDLTKKMSKEVYQEQMEQMESELAKFCKGNVKALGIPVILCVWKVWMHREKGYKLIN